jgi:alpha/beta superfamily hydrolase
MRPPAERHTLEGPAGKLEALLESGEGTTPLANAVICHPHPLHGGAMDNKVVHTLSRAFVGLGFRALRFNFRGVGQSEGEYDNGPGELQDALAAVTWMRNSGPDLPLWIAGFSFGAAIAIRTAMETEVDGLISIAPAAARLAKGMDKQPECPWLIIHGDQDELVDVDETVEWVNELKPGPELAVFQDSTHFFHGKLILLRQTVADFVEANKD